MKRLTNDFIPRPTLRNFFSLKRMGNPLYVLADKLFVFLEQKLRLRPILVGAVLGRIPYFPFRRGGSHSYAEWAFRTGLWRGILYKYLGRRTDAAIVDIGCGTGIMALSAEYFVNRGGSYLGIDIDAESVAFCCGHYAAPYFRFAHHAAHNGMYGKNETRKSVPYPADAASADIITAVSVWTHLTEADARFYMREVARILKPDGIALITMLVVDAKHASSLAQGMPRWPLYAFRTSAYGSDNWLTEAHVRLPETVIGIREDGVRSMCAEAGLVIKESIAGRWKDESGLYVQDVLVLVKK